MRIGTRSEIWLILEDELLTGLWHFVVGDRVRVLLAGPPQTFTVTGIVTFGTADNLAGATLAAFYLPTAQVLFNAVGYYDTINVLAKPGADKALLQRAIAKVLPRGVEVVTQVFRSVLAEALLVGLGASVVGLGLGVLAAVGLEELLKAFGITLPSGALVFEARTVLVAMLVGVGVTVVSAISPARRAVRVPPVAAIADHQADHGESLRRRVVAGSIIAVGGVALLLVGLALPAIQLVGLGALGVFVGAGDARAHRGATDVERPRTASGPAARDLREAGTGELHA